MHNLHDMLFVISYKCDDDPEFCNDVQETESFWNLYLMQVMSR